MIGHVLMLLIADGAATDAWWPHFPPRVRLLLLLCVYRCEAWSWVCFVRCAGMVGMHGLSVVVGLSLASSKAHTHEPSCVANKDMIR